MLSLSALDDLIQEQENLRLQSIWHLDELRTRQDRYRRCRFTEHRVPNQSNVSRGVGELTNASNVHSSFGKTVENCNERPYRPVSTVSKSSSVEGLRCLSADGSDGQYSQNSVDDRKYINARHSASAVLSDDLNSEKWSSSAARNARMKLTSGRMQMNLNNSSSVNIDSGHSVLVPASGTSVDSNGCRSLELDNSTAGYFSSASDADIGKLISTLTPQKSEQSLDETPKSILRHRQIIDKNVRVESKFDHTPTNVRSHRHRRGLNFSYSEVDDAELFGRRTKSVNFDVVDSKKSERESDAENTMADNHLHMSQVRSLKSSSFAGNTLPASTRFYDAPDASDLVEMSVNGSGACAASKLASGGLLLETGNDRQNAKIVRELESRSRSDLFSTDQPLVTSTSTSVSRSQVLCHFVFLILHVE